MKYTSILDVIQKCYHEENKIEKSTMNASEKRFYNKLDDKTEEKFKEYLLDSEAQKVFEEKLLISFVLNFVSEVNGKFRNPNNIYFD